MLGVMAARTASISPKGTRTNWRKRAEVGAIGGLGREADDGGGATVEVAVGDDDFSFVGGNAFGAVAPAAGGLDGGFDGFRAGVHRQCAAECGEVAQPFEEGAEPVGVEGAGDDGEALCLRGERGDQARMRMTVADGGVGTHHVEIAVALDIPDPDALGVREHDGQRRVVVGAKALFAFDFVHARAPPRCQSKCERDGTQRGHLLKRRR